MIRIGIDVGGTNTDAVLMDGKTVMAGVKAPTSADVMTGVVQALRNVLAAAKTTADKVDVVMIGTTHFTTAVVQRRDLAPVAAVRLCLPATASLPPMVDWPEDLRDVLGNHWYLAHGGNEFDGRVISRLDEAELLGIAADIRAKGIKSIAITSVFSPVLPSLRSNFLPQWSPNHFRRLRVGATFALGNSPIHSSTSSSKASFFSFFSHAFKVCSTHFALSHPLMVASMASNSAFAANHFEKLSVCARAME